MWLGTHQTFRDAFTFIFERTDHGWIWAHAYQFDESTSTFIVETTPEVYDALGFHEMSHEESAETCRQIFEAYLDGTCAYDQFGSRQRVRMDQLPRGLLRQLDQG